MGERESALLVPHTLSPSPSQMPDKSDKDSKEKVPLPKATTEKTLEKEKSEKKSEKKEEGTKDPTKAETTRVDLTKEKTKEATKSYAANTKSLCQSAEPIDPPPRAPSEMN